MNFIAKASLMNKAGNILGKIFTSNSSGGGWLVILRVGATIALIGKILSEFSFINLLYGSQGFVPKEIAVFSQKPYLPTIQGIFQHVPGFCSEPFFLKVFFLIQLLFAFFLLVGFMTRLSAFACWLMMVIVFNSSHLTSYGFDAMLLSLLFYAMIFPTRKKNTNPWLMSIFHKTIQLHICLIYFVNGISKVSGHGWQDGGGLWDAINQPQFHSALTPLLQKVMLIPHVPALIASSIILTEIAYPFLIWVRKINTVVLILIILLHVSIGVVMGLWLFAFTMIVFNLVAFGHVLWKN